MKRFLALLLVLSICFSGCMRKEENPQPLPFPDMELDAEAQDMAVLWGSIYWCADGKLYRLDPPAENGAAPAGEGKLFFDGFPVAHLSSDGERLALCSPDGKLLVGVPGADSMTKTRETSLAVPAGCSVTRLVLAGNTAVYCWREGDGDSDRVGFFNLSNGDFFEDTPSGEGEILLCGGGTERVFVCRPDTLNETAQLYGFDVNAMKRDVIFSAEGVVGIAAIGWNEEDGCLYALDRAVGGSNLYRWKLSGEEERVKMIPSDPMRNSPRKLIFVGGAAVVLHEGRGEITVCRELFGSDEDVTITVLVPDNIECELDRLSAVLLGEYGIRLVLKKMKTEVIDTKLLSQDDDYDLWIGTTFDLNLSYPVWEPLEDYPLIAEQTGLLFDDIVRICSINGHLFGLPYSMQLANCTLPWNSALADELGIEKPEPDWTLDDFLALARDLKERGYYICGDAWPVTLRDYMWRYFDPYGTGGLNDDGSALRKLLVWGKALEDEELLYPDSPFGPKDLVLCSGPFGVNIVYSTSETVSDPTIDGTEVYGDAATFLLMNPLSKHKEAASAVLAEMINPKNGFYTLPTSLMYYYKDFSLYRWDSPNPSDRAFLEEAKDEEDRAERERLVSERGARMIEAEKSAGTYTDIWNMDEKTRENYELYLRILSKYKLTRNYTKDWLMFALDECDLYLNDEQDLDYTVKRILDRAKMVLEG